MYILGISAYYHDSAACLMKDGKLIAAAQEERFTRIRHDAAFPAQSINYCLKQANITLDDIELVSYYEKPFLKFERILEKLLEYAPQTYRLTLKALPIWLKEKLWMRKTLWKEFERKIPVLFCNHHESHAASSFFPSPFEKAATLAVDGVGEWSTTTWGVGEGNKLELKQEIQFPNSLGLLYSAFTQYLGFKVNSGEYKVMGLAPYGDPIYADLIRNNLIEIHEDGSYTLNLEHFSFLKKQEMINEKFEDVFSEPRRKEESKLEKFHADIAKSIQVVIEEVMMKLAFHVHKETKMKHLCLAGGVALNCVSNGKILRDGPFEDIWIQPAAGDAGGAVGACYIAWHHFKQMPRPTSIGDLQQGSFLGPEFSDDEIETELKNYNINYKKHPQSEMIETTAGLLSEQNIVGWFQDRMEFGPRALGARSIIGDARDQNMQKRMNLSIKFRESFRPFAPSVLAEQASEFFDINTKSPYMLITTQVRNWKQAKVAVGQSETWISERLGSVGGHIPAVTHVDGSARVHTVESGTNPKFHALLDKFQKMTGSPTLINTSFNVRGEPIVCKPDDAIRCFLRTNMDALVIGSFVCQRKDQHKEVIEKIRSEDHFELD